MRPPTLVFLAVPTLTLASCHHNLKNVTARDNIQELRLESNIEKGFCRQNFVNPRTLTRTNRSMSTAIYYLLEGCVGFLYWDWVDAVEAWYAS